MALNILDSKIKIKGSTITGATPQIGPSGDFTDGTWTGATMVYERELFVNTADNRLWIGTNEIPMLVGTSGTSNTLAFKIVSGTTNSVVPTFGTNTNSSNYSTIAGGDNNIINTQSIYSNIVGGQNNTIYGTYSTIGGGKLNTITHIPQGGLDPGSNYNSIVGGSGNTINTGSAYSVIAGGENNTIISGSTHSSIIGGNNNLISGSTHSTIICGDGNIINLNGAYGSDRSTVFGLDNTLLNTDNSIIGGRGNVATETENVVIFGRLNNITSSLNSSITGGISNTINTGGISFIGGGQNNTISGGTGSFGVIAGGYNNINGSIYSSILGGGHNDTAGFTNTHIIGSNLTATKANTTYVENIKVKNVMQLQEYIVTAVPTASITPGGLIAITDDAGATLYVIAYSDGTNWKRMDNNNNIS